MNKNTSTADSFLKFFESALPDGLAAGLKSNLRAAANSAFGKLELVNSEEFEVQSRVLLRTREKLDQLEKKVVELEKKMQ